MPKLFSYIRWSSDRLEKGTASSRQDAAIEEHFRSSAVLFRRQAI